MHEEILNYMIANTCHHELIEPGIREFAFDLHCMEVKVSARFIGNWANDDIRYEIISWKAKEI